METRGQITERIHSMARRSGLLAAVAKQILGERENLINRDSMGENPSLRQQGSIGRERKGSDAAR